MTQFIQKRGHSDKNVTQRKQVQPIAHHLWLKTTAHRSAWASCPSTAEIFRWRGQAVRYWWMDRATGEWQGGSHCMNCISYVTNLPINWLKNKNETKQKMLTCPGLNLILSLDRHSLQAASQVHPVPSGLASDGTARTQTLVRGNKDVLVCKQFTFTLKWHCLTSIMGDIYLLLALEVARKKSRAWRRGMS